MTSIGRYLLWTCCAFALSGCASFNKFVTIDELWCYRHFGKECPTAKYVPPYTLQPPPGPAPDLNLRSMSCDTYFGVNLVTAHVRNDGDADVPAASGITVTVMATLRPGVVEITQNSLPGQLSAGAEASTFRIGVNHGWTQIMRVSVSAQTNLALEERNFTNNELDATVSASPLPDSSAFDQVYCEVSR